MSDAVVRRAFLSARWVNLALITYDVDPGLLDSSVPPGCELDTIDGRAFVSLVAFDFRDTRVLGVRWPGYMHFPEINLRFYVKRQVAGETRRGVSFIREFVPRRFIATMARAIYNEPYTAVPIASTTTEDDQSIAVEHVCTIEGKEQIIRVAATKPSYCPADDSVEHFFKEHSWGFGTSRRGKLIVYEVMHPLWNVFCDARVSLERWDFEAAYGEQWMFLNGKEPHSTILAAGSEVRVFPKDRG